MKKRKKRAFFYAIDMLLATLVTVVGLVLILSDNLQISSLTQATYTAQDVLSQLSTIRVNESGNTYVLELRFNGTIPAGDEYRTLIDTLGYFYVKSEYQNINGTLDSVISGILPDNYNALFTINGSEVYNRTVKDVSQAEAPFVITDRRLILGVTNETQKYGPFALEVSIW